MRVRYCLPQGNNNPYSAQGDEHPQLLLQSATDIYPTVFLVIMAWSG